MNANIQGAEAGVSFVGSVWAIHQVLGQPRLHKDERERVGGRREERRKGGKEEGGKKRERERKQEGRDRWTEGR